MAAGELRLGIYGGFDPRDPARYGELARLAESLGYDSIWTGEAYGTDAATPLAYLAASTSTIGLGTGIMQMPARTPAMTAMTIATIDLLSGGRARLGLGMSGPQVVEGWHGRPYTRPLATTREYVEIVRGMLRREEPTRFDGDVHRIPFDGPGATGLGKPLKLMVRPRPDIPIYLAAIGPKNMALAAEVADGLLPIFWSPERSEAASDGALDGVDLTDFDIAPTVQVAIGDDVDACRDRVRPLLALYVGGMGAKGRNFYNDLVRRYGYEAEAEQIQDLYLGGDQRAAAAAVPDQLIDEVALVGPVDRIADRLDAWRESPVRTMNLVIGSPRAVQTMAELAFGA
jgi:F420-dependent oxidoreductase-like protein